jgi:ribosomal protein S21
MALTLAASPPAAAATPTAPPAPPAAVQPDRDLRTIAEAFVPPHALEALLEQGVDVVLRTKRERDGEWQAMERQTPGLTDATLRATRQAATAEVPRMVAALQADAAAFFSERLTAPERARFAAYLRLPYPRRMTDLAVDVRPGETLVEALKRLTKALQSSATAQELRQEQQFYATPIGQKCNALTAEYLKRSDAKQGEIVFPVLKAALAKGDAAGAAFIAAHAAH